MKPKEAFEILRDTPIDIRSAREDDIHSLYATAQNMALDALERQMWIPCSERLPEEGAVVLVSLEEDEDWSWVRLVREGYYDEGYWFDTDGAHYGLEILAWMPLPEPYKEEGAGHEE